MSTSPDKLCVLSTTQEIALGVTELAYVAGFFDGEGSVMIAKRDKYKGRQRYYLVAQITNTYLDVLVMLQARYGGRLKARQRRQGWKTGYDLRWSGPEAADFIQKIYPFLIVKKTKAEIGLRFQATMGDKTAYEAREKMRAEMKES